MSIDLGQAAANGRRLAETCKSAAFKSAPPSILNREARVKRHQIGGRKNIIKEKGGERRPRMEKAMEGDANEDKYA